MNVRNIVSGIYIYGAGAHGRVIADSALRGGFRNLTFIDDQARVSRLQGFPVLAADVISPSNWIGQPVIVAIGSNLARARIFRQLLEWGAVPTSIIDPTSIIAPSVTIGAGSFLAPGVVINNGASVGANCIVNTRASVDHDCVLGDHTQVSPGVCLAGNVDLGELVMIGVGAVIVPGRRVGRNTVVGAGAVVTRDLGEGVTAWGVPARRIRPVS